MKKDLIDMLELRNHDVDMGEGGGACKQIRRLTSGSHFCRKPKSAIFFFFLNQWYLLYTMVKYK